MIDKTDEPYCGMEQDGDEVGCHRIGKVVDVVGLGCE
jgi:hypothetical protein